MAERCMLCKGKGYYLSLDVCRERFCTCRIGREALSCFEGDLELWKGQHNVAEKLVDKLVNCQPVTHIWRYSGYRKECMAAVFHCRLCRREFLVNVDRIQRSKEFVLPSGKQWKDINIRRDFDLFECLLPKGGCWKPLIPPGALRLGEE